MAELRQEVSESRNTIYQLRKNMEPSKRHRQGNWQGEKRMQEHQLTEQSGPKAGVRVPDGGCEGTQASAEVARQGSQLESQAHMLQTSRRSSDSDEELMYERAYLVRPTEDINRSPKPKEDCNELDQEVDSPFDMSQIKTQVMDGDLPEKGQTLCGSCWILNRIQNSLA